MWSRLRRITAAQRYPFNTNYENDAWLPAEMDGWSPSEAKIVDAASDEQLADLKSLHEHQSEGSKSPVAEFEQLRRGRSALLGGGTRIRTFHLHSLIASTSWCGRQALTAELIPWSRSSTPCKISIEAE